jgi:imidazolonepropionase-like amidohydrolase
MSVRRALAALLAVTPLVACAEEAATDSVEIVSYNADPYPSTYVPLPSTATAIVNAHILDGVGGEIESGAVVLEGGHIVAIGADVAPPDGAVIVDAGGRWVTPGIVDIHSHLGVYPSPGDLSAHQDGNEISGPVTAEVWAEHGVWPQDPGFAAALAGGVTTLHVLPGSANLFGGRGVTLRNVPARTVQGMKFPGAPYTLKMACGENPKRLYGYGSGAAPGGSPYSRMGNVAEYRAAWQRGVEYRRSWRDYLSAVENGEHADAPARDLELDTLMGVLDGDILVQMHCYRADEMAQILDMAEEFGYRVSAFHHAVEAYKIPDLLQEAGTCAAMWADWWGFKMEAYDAVRENIPIVHAAGACATVHSDSDIGGQRLNQEIAKALGDGRRAGLDITKADAWSWASANPARALGIYEETGSLEIGKRADVVLWSGDPFSTYTRADLVYVDGALVHDRADPARVPLSDFMLGQPALEAAP